jgi:uncharacterized protein (DUF1800 family)
MFFQNSTQAIDDTKAARGPDTPATPATPAKADAADITGASDEISSSLRAIKPEKFGYEQARHLLWRAGLGGNEQQIRMLVSWGPEKSVDYLLNPEKVNDPSPPKPDAFNKDIMRPPTEEERQMFRMAQRNQNEDELAKIRIERQNRERADREQMSLVQQWWLKRMIETGRPLEEKLVLFWHGILATSFRVIENSYHMYQQNQLFRKHALGNYGDMLKGLIRDPAMLAYLDNNDSRKNRPNENLAREIMELFSLGVGNYTEKDIKEGARALTGYTFRDDTFVKDTANHDTGTKVILGRSGNWDGDDFVDIILSQPACSKYVSRRLYSYFVADVPSDERGGDKGMPRAQRVVLRELAEMLRSRKYEIKPVLRRLFLSEHFYDDTFVSQQIKSPAMLTIGAVRSLNTPVRDLTILNDAMDLMGQRLFLPPSVKGWEGGRSWINTSTLYVRQNVLAFLLTGKKPQGYDSSADTSPYDASTLFAGGEKGSALDRGEPEAVVRAVLMLTLGHAPQSALEPLVTFARSRGANAMEPQTLTGLMLLATAMPEYQLC